MWRQFIFIHYYLSTFTHHAQCLVFPFYFICLGFDMLIEMWFLFIHSFIYFLIAFHTQFYILYVKDIHSFVQHISVANAITCLSCKGLNQEIITMEMSMLHGTYWHMNVSFLTNKQTNKHTKKLYIVVC